MIPKAHHHHKIARALVLMAAGNHLLSQLPLASGQCYIRVYNKWRTDLTLSTYNGGDLSCWATYNTWTIPKGGSNVVWCQDDGGCQLKLNTDPVNCLHYLTVNCDHNAAYEDWHGQFVSCQGDSTLTSCDQRRKRSRARNLRGRHHPLILNGTRLEGSYGDPSAFAVRAPARGDAETLREVQ